MSIVVISSLTTYTAAEHFIRALHRQRSDVVVVSDRKHELATYVVKPTFSLSTFCHDHHISPSLIIMIDGGTMRMLPLDLEQMRCLCVWWGIDTHLNFQRHKNTARLFDFTYIAQKHLVESLQMASGRPVGWLPLAYPHDLEPESLPERTLDISFVGSLNQHLHEERTQMIETIKQHVPRNWFGRASPQDMVQRYLSSWMVFNKSVHGDINMRYFEAMGAGAVLLTDKLPDHGQDDLFPNDCYVTYGHIDDCIDQAKTLLNDKQSIMNMGARARQHILQNHTYDHRVRTLLIDTENKTKYVAADIHDYLSASLSMGLTSQSIIFFADQLRSNTQSKLLRALLMPISFVLHSCAVFIRWIGY